MTLMLLHMAFAREDSWPVVNHPRGPGPILAFGDSLTAGRGASAGGTYTDHLSLQLGEQLLVEGRSGDTSEQALGRLDQAVATRPSLVVVTLGGNDVMRKVPRSRTRAALQRIFTRFQEGGAMVAYTALEPPFVEPGWVEEIHGLCRELGVIYIPDVLADVWLDPSAKADPVHPNEKGYLAMAGRVAAGLEPYLAPSGS